MPFFENGCLLQRTHVKVITVKLVQGYSTREIKNVSFKGFIN